MRAKKQWLRHYQVMFVIFIPCVKPKTCLQYSVKVCCLMLLCLINEFLLILDEIISTGELEGS